MKNKESKVKKNIRAGNGFIHFTFIFPLFFLFSLFSFLFIGCDLFSSVKEDDLLKRIDEEIAWANAAKINIIVAYPNAWGTSPQLGTGRCFDIKRPSETPRKGYTFNVEFNPNVDYALLGWRAYRTDDLPNGWTSSPDNTENKLRNIKQIENIILPEIDENGGIGGVTINASETNVTLIPFCRAQPRIVSSSPDKNAAYYSRANPIIITFASTLQQDSVKFDLNNISITYRELDEQSGQPKNEIKRLDGLGQIDPPPPHYKVPRFPDSRTILIEPIIDSKFEYPDSSGFFYSIFSAPENSEISLTLGRGIKTAMGSNWEKPVTFVWRTNEGGAIVDFWEASYENGQFAISWNVEGGDGIPEVTYSYDGGITTDNV